MKSSYLSLLILVQFFVIGSIFAQRPVDPSNGTVAIISRTELEISWQDNSNNEDLFIIVTFPGDELVAASGANTTSYTVEGLASGSRVQYEIYAYKQESDGTASFSNPTLTPAVIVPDGIIRYGHQATVGQPFSAELYTDVYDLQTSASVTNLPSWAMFDEATRTVSGTPDAGGIHFLNLDIDYSDGFNITQTVPLRVLPANSGPLLATELPSPEYSPSLEPQDIDLNSYFIDPDCSRAARIEFNVGRVDIVLYEDATPDTVSNFLKYVSEDPNTGQTPYEGAMIHRSIPGFAIRGGGFRPTGGNSFASVPDFGSVVNEPGLENVRGTLSMAKLESDPARGGDPNLESGPDSATSEWLINLDDNRSNLDFQNGGFTVFGRVAGNGMVVVDEIADLPTGNYPSITVDDDELQNSTLLSDCPMNVDPGSAPTNMEQDKLVVIESAVEIDPLEYEVVSNTDESVAQATVINSTLQITPLNPGTCTLRIKAIDRDNNEFEEDLVITVLGWTFEDWSAAQGLSDEQKGLLDDADGDSLPNFIEYALFGDPIIATPALAQSQTVSSGEPSPQDHLAIEFSTRNVVEDAIIRVEATDQLSLNTNWTELWNLSQGSSAAHVHSVDVQADHTDWVIRDTQSNSSSESRFMRVRVEHVGSQ